MPARQPVTAIRQQTEREFQTAVLQYATLRRWRHWHDAATNTPRRCSDCGAIRRTPRNAPGYPDLLLVRRPRIVWAELKSEHGGLSINQQAWIDELRNCGQTVFIWRPSDWAEIGRVLL